MLNYNENVIKDAEENNGIVKAQSIGGGFMMISKQVPHKMIEKFPETEYKNFDNDKFVANKNYNLFHSFIEPNSQFYLSEELLNRIIKIMIIMNQ